MKDAENVKEISTLGPDFMGFIFYEPSKRNALGINPQIVRSLPDSVCPVGVFVNSSMENIIEIADTYGLNTIQLHGDESPELCRLLKDKGLNIIKALQIKDLLPNNLEKYSEVIDIFIFDAAGKQPGGNGFKFNWELLDNYTLDIPFLLSGGIGPDDYNYILQFSHPNCIGIDLNSKFEIEPGIKNPISLFNFFYKIKKYESS